MDELFLEFLDTKVAMYKHKRKMDLNEIARIEDEVGEMMVRCRQLELQVEKTDEMLNMIYDALDDIEYTSTSVEIRV